MLICNTINISCSRFLAVYFSSLFFLHVLPIMFYNTVPSSSLKKNIIKKIKTKLLLLYVTLNTRIKVASIPLGCETRSILHKFRWWKKKIEMVNTCYYTRVLHITIQFLHTHSMYIVCTNSEREWDKEGARIFLII